MKSKEGLRKLLWGFEKKIEIHQKAVGICLNRGYRTSSFNFFQDDKLPVNTVIKFVPQQTAWVVERMGKFHSVLKPGIVFLVPFLDQIAYVHSLKESAIEISSQNAITLDNVLLELNGILYVKVFDPVKASYGVENFPFAISQLAQTTMRSEIGSMTLDAVLKERQMLNTNINRVINEAARDNWGVECLRYEIKDIHPPQNVLDAMHRQVSAERSKRAEILESEGQRQYKINISEGEKTATILRSEAYKTELINKAKGESESMLMKSKAAADSIRMISDSISEKADSGNAISFQIAQEYIKQFGNLAKSSNSIIVPTNMGDMSSFISGGISIFDTLTRSLPKKSSEKENLSPLKNNSGREKNSDHGSKQIS